MKNRVQKKGGMLRGTATQVYPSKKKRICDGEVFLLDRGLLMGAIIFDLTKVHVTSANLVFFGVLCSILQSEDFAVYLS